ncbi:MAG: hypothetical protein JSV62_07210 [Promethearchaeota archaeon]|nr:MAG: hypothetical protein JSV62_07210 [Candidatus Lokiarchaeota archaeon]
MSKIKTKRKNSRIILVGLIFLFTCNFYAFNSFGAPTPTLSYSWREVNYSNTFVTIWDGTSNVIKYKGSYADTYNFTKGKLNESENTWTRSFSTVNFDANYSYFSNKTLWGNLTVDLDLDLYQVNIDYGGGLQFIWMALKKGILESVQYNVIESVNYTYLEDNRRIVDTTFEKYNLTTMELISTWNDTHTEFGEINFTHRYVKDAVPFNWYQYDYQEFTMPLFLTMQIFETENHDHIAWANLFCDFLMYKDKDENAIYSVGDSGDYPSLWGSSEFCGFLRPIAIHESGHNIYYNIFGDSHESKGRNLYPIDRTVDSFADTIQFTAPTTIGDKVTWDIVYPGFPLDGAQMDQDYSTSEWFYFPLNASYAETSPGDYAYQFDYTIDANESKADCSVSVDLPKITNSTCYEAVSDYGLVIPQYNYFLSSFDIDEIDMKEITVPADKLSFESNGLLVAEFEMDPFDKRNYTLSDFRGSGEDIVLESQGASLNPFIQSLCGSGGHSDQPVLDLLYAIEETVEAGNYFTISDELYRISTQNYPVWGGDRLIHDPVLTVYFTDNPTTTSANIPGYSIVIITGAVALTIIYFVRRRKSIFK